MATESVASTKMVITIGRLTYTYDLAFLACLILAVVVVFLFAVSKFDEPTMEKKDDDLVSQLLPRYLTTPRQYSHALMLYATSMAAFVVVLSVLGPRVVAIGGAEVPDAPNALPLMLALVIVGVLPNVPWLQQVERQIRRFAHERAFIPRAARATGELLAAAEFDFSAYKADNVLKTPAMRGVQLADFGLPRDSIEYGWARLSALLYEVRRLQYADLTASLDDELLQRYAKDLENLSLLRKSLEDDVAQYRKDKQDNPYTDNETLHGAIRNALRQLYVLLGCAVRLKRDGESEMNSALRRFGFVLDAGSTSYDGDSNVMIMGLGVMTCCVFALGYAAYGVTLLDLWTPSAIFPQQGVEAFKWSLSAALAHSCAILVANLIRGASVQQGRWFTGTGQWRRRNATKYVFVAIAGGVAGFVVQFCWGLLFVNASLDLAKAALPFSLLPASTAGFYVWHLDNVELGERPQRYREIGTHALVAGFCALVTASIVQQAVDFTLLFVAFGVAIGASLAWYIPSAAESSRFDPLAEARAARVASLKAEAARAFGGPEPAERWLDGANPALGDQTPRDAASEIRTFEQALSLLQAPSLAKAS